MRKIMNAATKAVYLVSFLLLGVTMAAAYTNYNLNCSSASCGPNKYEVKVDSHSTVVGKCTKANTVISMPTCEWNNNASEGNDPCTKQNINSQQINCICHNKNLVSPLDMSTGIACAAKN